MISAFIYIQIYVEYCCSTILFFVPGLFTYKQFALFTAILSSLCILFLFYKSKGRLKLVSFGGVILVLLLIGLFFFTRYHYSESDLEYYHSYYLVFAGQTAPGVITALLLSQTADFEKKIKRIAPFVSIIFTFIAFACSLHPSLKTSGGLAANTNYLNYQTLSYMAAYATGFAEFTLLTDSSSVPAFFKSKAGIITEYGIIFINLFTILISGGRGGIVNFIVFAVVSVIIAIRKNKITVAVVVKSATLLAFLGIMGAVTINYAAKTNISTSGFDRIKAFVSGKSSISGRQQLQSSAIMSFKKSPLFGHGLGSVFPEVGFHSHNLFTDALVETGVVGVTIIVIVLFVTIRKLIIMAKYDFSNLFWIYVFLCGFVMAMFSGYYLAQLPVWWVMAYAMGRTVSDDKTVLDLGKE